MKIIRLSIIKNKASTKKIVILLIPKVWIRCCLKVKVQYKYCRIHVHPCLWGGPKRYSFFYLSPYFAVFRFTGTLSCPSIYIPSDIVMVPFHLSIVLIVNTTYVVLYLYYYFLLLHLHYYYISINIQSSENLGRQ